MKGGKSLRIPSRGRATACHAWPSFHSGPCASCRCAPLMSNVRCHVNSSTEKRQGRSSGCLHVGGEHTLGRSRASLSQALVRSGRPGGPRARLSRSGLWAVAGLVFGANCQSCLRPSTSSLRFSFRSRPCSLRARSRTLASMEVKQVAPLLLHRHGGPEGSKAWLSVASNPSFEGTSSGMLRMPTAAPQVKRYASRSCL